MGNCCQTQTLYQQEQIIKSDQNCLSSQKKITYLQIKQQQTLLQQSTQFSLSPTQQENAVYHFKELSYSNADQIHLEQQFKEFLLQQKEEFYELQRSIKKIGLKVPFKLQNDDQIQALRIKQQHLVNAFDLDLQILDRLTKTFKNPLDKQRDYLQKGDFYIQEAHTLYTSQPLQESKPQQSKVQYWNTIFNSEGACLKACIDILKHMKQNRMNYFGDVDFGPKKQLDPNGTKSLFFQFIPQSFPQEGEIVWMRPKQILQKQTEKYKQNNNTIINNNQNFLTQEFDQRVHFFDRSTQGRDIIQGQLNNYWFTQALSLVSNNGNFMFGNVNYQKPWDKLTTQEKKEISDGVYPSLFHFLAKYGLYVLRFYKDDQWRYVIIDDQIPVTKTGDYIFSHSRNPNEFYVQLIEKAYAKIHNCYEALNFGDLQSALKDLTGQLPIIKNLDNFKYSIQKKKFVNQKNEQIYQINLFDSTKLDLQYIGFDEAQIKYNESLDELWEFMQKNLKQGSALGCVEKTGKDCSTLLMDQNNQETGLYQNQFYQILDCFDLKYSDQEIAVKKQNYHNTHRILRLKNPWGFGSWKLKWSDNNFKNKLHDFSEKIQRYFSRQQNKALGNGQQIPDRYLPQENDGTFLICFKDWRNLFTQLYVTKKFDQNWIGKSVMPQWPDNVTPGVILNTEDSKKQYIQKNPQYLIQIKPVYQLQKVNLVIQMQQKEARWFSDLLQTCEPLYHSLFGAIYKLDSEEFLIKEFDMEKMVSSNQRYQRNREVNTGLISLSPGLYSFIPSIGEYNLVNDIELKFLYDCDHNEIKITEVYDSTQNTEADFKEILSGEETYEEDQLGLILKQHLHSFCIQQQIKL